MCVCEQKKALFSCISKNHVFSSNWIQDFFPKVFPLWGTKQKAFSPFGSFGLKWREKIEEKIIFKRNDEGFPLNSTASSTSSSISHVKNPFQKKSVKKKKETTNISINLVTSSPLHFPLSLISHGHSLSSNMCQWVQAKKKHCMTTELRRRKTSKKIQFRNKQ